MTDKGIGLEGTTVVVRGAFNPAIFSPTWFRNQDLIGDLELDDLDVEIVTRDIAVFRMGWLSCHVTPEGLQMSASAPEEFERLRDAVIGVLRLLTHTPIKALGINREFHTQVASVEEWHAIGDAIVPKANWNGTLEHPGMRSVTLWGARPDEYGGQIQVQVEPSVRLPQSVYVATNDHFTLTLSDLDLRSNQGSWDLTQPEVELTSEKIDVAIHVLLDQWDAALERAEQARRTVVGLAGGGR